MGSQLLDTRASAREQGIEIGGMILRHRSVEIFSKEQWRKRRPGRTALSPSKCVYFVAPKPFKEIKIGYASQLFDRLHQLQTGCAYELEILAASPGSLALERRVHAIFAEERLKGEWFQASPKLCTLIRWLQKDSDLVRALADLGHG